MTVDGDTEVFGRGDFFYCDVVHSVIICQSIMFKRNFQIFTFVRVEGHVPCGSPVRECIQVLL